MFDSENEKSVWCYNMYHVDKIVIVLTVTRYMIHCFFLIISLNFDVFFLICRNLMQFLHFGEEYVHHKNDKK